MKLRDYQEAARLDIRASVAQGVRRLMVQMPTGSGKTVMAGDICIGAARKGGRASFVVPSISLVDQAIEDFYKLGIRDIGVIQSDHHMTDWSQPIQICSIQTIDRRGAYPPSNVVMFDEAHETFAAHLRWMKHRDWADVPFIGLSATPWSKGLGRHYQSLLVATTTKQLIAEGYLSPFRVYAAPHPDLTKVKVVAGDYAEGELSAVMQDTSLAADIIRTYKEKWGKGKTLCFAVDRAHALSLQARFEFAGIRCGFQDKDTTPAERADLKRKYHSGEYEIVINIQTLTKGIDWDVRCLILARPTRSEMLYVQIIGRALRLAPGKEYALILDHSDSTARLGFVDDIHHEYLDMGRKAEARERKAKARKEPLPKECFTCGFMKPPSTRFCPQCGARNEIQSTIIEEDGELIEVEKRNGTMHQAAKVKPYLWTMEERALFLSELKAYGEQHGYKPGWSAAKYKDKFKDWPPWEIKDVHAAEIVSPTTAAWIRSRNIAWIKSKNRKQKNAPSEQPAAATARDAADEGEEQAGFLALGDPHGIG